MILNNIEQDLDTIMEIIHTKHNAKNLNFSILIIFLISIFSSLFLFFYFLNLYSFSIFYLFPFLLLIATPLILFLNLKDKEHSKLFFYTSKTYSKKIINKILDLYNTLTPESRFVLSSMDLRYFDTKEDFLFSFLIEDLKFNKKTFINDNQSYYIDFIKKHFKDSKQNMLIHQLNKRINSNY